MEIMVFAGALIIALVIEIARLRAREMAAREAEWFFW